MDKDTKVQIKEMHEILILVKDAVITKELPKRVDKLEAWKDKWLGAFKVISIMALLSGIGTAVWAAVTRTGG